MNFRHTRRDMKHGVSIVSVPSPMLKHDLIKCWDHSEGGYCITEKGVLNFWPNWGVSGSYKPILNHILKHSLFCLQGGTEKVLKL